MLVYYWIKLPPLTHATWGGRSTFSSSILPCQTSWHHLLLYLSFRSSHNWFTFTLAFFSLSIHIIELWVKKPFLSYTVHSLIRNAYQIFAISTILKMFKGLPPLFSLLTNPRVFLPVLAEPIWTYLVRPAISFVANNNNVRFPQNCCRQKHMLKMTSTLNQNQKSK